jgi:putative zinc finger/helix-turn-helix YgiT family protein
LCSLKNPLKANKEGDDPVKRNKCPICGEGKLERQVTNEKFDYKGNSVTVPGYVKYTCSLCKESIVDNTTLKKSAKILKEFQCEVDGLLTVPDIKEIRKIRTNVTQERLARRLGMAPKTFARYEARLVCQSKPMDDLLRILGVYPDLIRVIEKDAEMLVRRKQFMRWYAYPTMKYVAKTALLEGGEEHGRTILLA